MFKAQKIFISVIVLSTALLTVAQVNAQQGSKEYLVKAAFLFNFAKFVEWPDDRFNSKEAPIELCVVGQNPFGDVLTALAAKEIKGRSINVSRLAAIGDQDQCHIAFLALNDEEDRSTALEALSNLHALTVSDSAEFASSGGVIEFRPVNKKIGFVINRSLANDLDLTISSKLLALAEEIR